MKQRVIILAGASGSGKSFLEKQLVTMYPDTFNKLMQVTTRPMREGETQGNPYIFISKEKYKEIEHKLIGKTEIHGNLYGTLFEPHEDKYNTIILDKGGIDSFESTYPDFNEVEYIIVMVDSRKLVPRDGRDLDYVENERWNIREVMNICIVHNPPHYKDLNETKNRIIEFFDRYHDSK